MLTILRRCAICSRRDGTLTVVMDDIPTDICDTCYERGDEAGRDVGFPEDHDLEGQPEFNGAFDRW